MKNILNLHIGEEDKNKVLENVKSNISFTGSNLWILACAIMVASVGLNVNSTAVIIGAMLISPLMGPIVGAGFAMGTLDFSLLKKSLVNLLIATVASLLVATIYFTLSPFKDAQSELLARTSPNIYDVLIAFFGGLVGVIAITRVEKGNPIPGVAIATALMPPLCTAGFGLATGHWNFFFGALFLYSINCVFICIATFIIVKYLHYPTVKQIDEKLKTKINYIVYSLVFLMLLPSTYFAYCSLQEQKFRKNAELFIEKEFIEKGHVLVFKKLNYTSSNQKIEVGFLKKQYTKSEVQQLVEKLKDYHLEQSSLVIKEGANNFDQFKNDILNEVSKKEQQMATAQNSIKDDAFDNKQIFLEANALFPAIKAISVSEQTFAYRDSLKATHIVIYEIEKALTANEEETFTNWLKQKLNTETIDVFSKK